MAHRGLLHKLETKSAGQDTWAALPVVTSIRFFTGKQRTKPKTGDRRETKKHGLQIRIPVMVHDLRGRPIGYNCTGGRLNYEWRKPSDLPPAYRYLLTSEEKIVWATP